MGPPPARTVCQVRPPAPRRQRCRRPRGSPAAGGRAAPDGATRRTQNPTRLHRRSGVARSVFVTAFPSLCAEGLGCRADWRSSGCAWLVEHRARIIRMVMSGMTLQWIPACDSCVWTSWWRRLHGARVVVVPVTARLHLASLPVDVLRRLQRRRCQGGRWISCVSTALSIAAF